MDRYPEVFESILELKKVGYQTPSHLLSGWTLPVKQHHFIFLYLRYPPSVTGKGRDLDLLVNPDLFLETYGVRLRVSDCHPNRYTAANHPSVQCRSQSDEASQMHIICKKQRGNLKFTKPDVAVSRHCVHLNHSIGDHGTSITASRCVSAYCCIWSDCDRATRLGSFNIDWAFVRTLIHCMSECLHANLLIFLHIVLL